VGNNTHVFLLKTEDIVHPIDYMEIDMDGTKFLLLFGRNMKRLRNSQNLSLRQMATRCNIDYSDIGKIEKGNRNIQMSTVLELSKGLGVHPKELFDFEFEWKPGDFE
tara:strand:- start:425 stop:745 length:321 start_codon:yes stop_codon:yes gene_type:complete